MRKFMVNVNGNSYQVEVEEIGGTSVAAAPAPAAPTSAPAPAPAAPAAAPAPAPKAKAVEGGTTVVAPMPGTILSIIAGEGTSVKKGDVLLILEAMKMENEIMSPMDGVVAAINVDSGQSVNANDVLAVIK
ncbi:MAG: biotin/lipoyl-containing protein [Christensenellales bacterium]